MLLLFWIWKTYEKKTRILEKEKNEIRKLRKKTCEGCKTVYTSIADESISFDENFDKYSLPFPYYKGDDDEYMVDYNRIYRLDNYLFVSFHDEDSEGKCYLTNLTNGLIYLPIDNNEWKKVLGDGTTFYRQLCSERANHFGSLGKSF